MNQIHLNSIKYNGYKLKYVLNQTPEICLMAVRENGFALKFVKNQTDKICIEAIKKYGTALQYVVNQTELICRKAVLQDGHALQYVKNKTNELCLLAVINNSFTLKFIENQTPEIILYALINNDISSIYIKNNQKFYKNLFNIDYIINDNKEYINFIIEYIHILLLSKKLKIKFLDIYIKNYHSKLLDNKLIKFIDDEDINNYFIENNISTFDVKLSEYKYDILGDIIDYSDIYDDNNLDELYNKTEDPNIAFYCIRRSLEKYNKNIKYLYYL